MNHVFSLGLAVAIGVIASLLAKHVLELEPNLLSSLLVGVIVGGSNTLICRFLKRKQEA